MPAPRREIVNLLDVDVPPGGTVITISDLHLPPVRTDVSGRSCETLAGRLDDQAGPLTVVLAGDVVELLGYPDATVSDILRAHEDLCVALTAVTARGGQVIYAIGNHDSDLAWDVKAADAVRELTGARLCLAADLLFPDEPGVPASGGRVRVEHGHQLDPYNCFCDPRNSLDTPLGHHIVRAGRDATDHGGSDAIRNRSLASRRSAAIERCCATATRRSDARPAGGSRTSGHARQLAATANRTGGCPRALAGGARSATAQSHRAGLPCGHASGTGGRPRARGRARRSRDGRAAPR